MGLQENIFLSEKEYIETFFKIKSKESGVIPFQLNMIQCDYLENRKLRNIILKGRQHGFTSLIVALYLYETLTNSGVNSAIIGHDQAAMENIFDNVKLMLSNVPEFMRPKIKYDNKGQLTFPELNSSMFITTYRTKRVISGTIHNLLCTECALWEGDVFDVMAAIEQAVPMTGSITIESTPRGIGGYFFESVKQAKEKESEYRLFVYPWFVNTDYRVERSQWPLMPERVRLYENDYGLDRNENYLIEKWGLSIEQIAWRRYKMFSMKDMVLNKSGIRTSRLFSREYECNFQQSGMTVFDVSYIIPTVHFLTLPRKKSRYVHGADTCEGVEGGDYAVLYTIDLDSSSVVCKERGLWKVGEFADKIHKHCLKWGGLIAVERNNTGHGTLEKLSMLYNKEVESGRKIPYSIFSDDDGRLGWNTRESNRKLMISELEEALREDTLKIAFEDDNGIEELSAFRYNPKTMKEEAPSGMHDDSVIALCVAWQMRKWYHIYEKQSKEVEAKVTVF